MGIIFPIAVGVIATAAAVIFVLADKNKWHKIFSELSQTCGINLIPATFAHFVEASGAYKGFHVRVFRYNFSHGKSSTPTVGFSIEIPAIPASSITIKAETFFTRLQKKGGRTDVEFDDSFFDDAAFVSGRSVPEVRALLHPRARAIVAGLITAAYSKKFTIADGLLTTYQVTNRFPSSNAILDVLRQCVELAELFSRKRSTAALLEANYLAEYSPRVKARYLESLADTARHLTEKNAAVRDAIDSNDPELRFQALRAIGEPGYALLPQILRNADDDLAALVLEWMTAKRPPETLALLEKFRTQSHGIDVRTTLCRVYAAFADPSAEPYLRRELDETPGGEHQKACLEALGSCGAYETIEFLYDRRKLGTAHEIDRAIETIRQRIGAGTEGRLSVSTDDGEEGKLSST